MIHYIFLPLFALCTITHLWANSGCGWNWYLVYLGCSLVVGYRLLSDAKRKVEELQQMLDDTKARIEARRPLNPDHPVK